LDPAQCPGNPSAFNAVAPVWRGNLQEIGCHLKANRFKRLAQGNPPGFRSNLGVVAPSELFLFKSWILPLKHQ